MLREVQGNAQDSGAHPRRGTRVVSILEVNCRIVKCDGEPRVNATSLDYGMGTEYSFGNILFHTE
jgi:hypothetical protein